MNKEFTATLVQSEAKGGWTYLVWPESVEYFGTRGLVKVPGDHRRLPVPERIGR